MRFITYLILSSLLLTGCIKANVTPVSVKSAAITTKADSAKSVPGTVKADNSAYDWYNGTTGTATIQVTCNNCSAIATIGSVTTPFIFNNQGVGQLKYTPKSGLLIYIAVCPSKVEAIKADVFDASGNVLYTYSAVSGNWSNSYIIK